MKKLLSLFVLLVAIVTGANADEYILASSKCEGSATFTVDGKVFTLSPAHGGTGQTGYSDYIKFSKNKSYTLTLPEGFQLTNINVKGYTNSNGNTNGELVTVAGESQTEKTFPAKNDSGLASTTQITDGYDFSVSQTGGTIEFKTANTNQICVLITVTGTAATETKVATPTFSPEASKFATETMEVTLSSLTDGAAIQYSTDNGTTWNDYSAPFTIDATTTIKAKATKSGLTDSEDATKTYTKVTAINVYDAAGVEDGTLSLEKSNVTDAEYAYFSVTNPNWASKTWSGYEGDYLDMKSSNAISVKVKNVGAFEFFISGTEGRKYTIQVGEAEAVEYTQSSSSGFVSSGIIATGTTDEVTITIQGGSSTLYPVYMKVYPSTTITLNASGFATYSSEYDFTYEGADAYGMKLTATSLQGTKVTTGKVKAGEGILFKGEAGATVTITETTGAEALENNDLVGTTDADGNLVTAPYENNYALSGDTFKKFTGASLAANKAFFSTETSLGTNALAISFDDIATAISNVEANAEAAAPVKVIKNGKLYIGNYNVAGQQVK